MENIQFNFVFKNLGVKSSDHFIWRLGFDFTISLTHDLSFGNQKTLSFYLENRIKFLILRWLPSTVPFKIFELVIDQLFFKLRVHSNLRLKLKLVPRKTSKSNVV